MTGRPSMTKARLAELDAISRERPFTDAEQRECRWLACQERWLATKRRRYAEDPTYRERILAWQRSKREAG